MSEADPSLTGQPASRLLEHSVQDEKLQVRLPALACGEVQHRGRKCGHWYDFAYSRQW